MASADSALLVSAAAGVCGALVGGAISLGTTWILESRRQNYENRVRYHDRRLDLYADLTHATRRVVALIVGGEAIPDEAERGMNPYAQLLGRLSNWSTLRARVELVGSPALREKVEEAAREFRSAAEAADEANDEAKKGIRQKANRLTSEMEEIARSELGAPDLEGSMIAWRTAVLVGLGVLVMGIGIGVTGEVIREAASGSSGTIDEKKANFAADYCAQWAPKFVGPGIGVLPAEPADVPSDVAQWWDNCMARMGAADKAPPSAR